MSRRQPIRSVRGMHDLLPQDAWAWRRLHRRFHDLASSYGYVYARTPIVEDARLFERGVGETSDIVMGEMYSFADKGGGQLCLRPEGTAPMVRMGLQHGLMHHRLHKFCYDGPMFRRERPQKGRYRQFHQVGVEVFGDAGHWAELELLLLARAFLDDLGLDAVSLQINTLGERDEMDRYRRSLYEYFSAHEAALGESDRERLRANPLRILDSKDPAISVLIEEAPVIDRHLGADSRARFEALCAALDELSCAYTIAPRLVRGLEYYSHTVFEWVADDVDQAQNTLIAGGRYDELSTMIGARVRVPACGFAAGVERLLELAPPPQAFPPRLSLIADGEPACLEMTRLAARLRERFDCEVCCDFSPRSLAARIRDRGYRPVDILLVMGEREFSRRSVVLSSPSGAFLESDGEKILLELASLEAWLSARLTTSAAAGAGAET